MATFIIRYLRNLFDVDTTGAVPGDNLTYNGSLWVPGAGGGGGGAPTTATYLTGTADAALTNEIVVGPTPGGELGNTWASPTVDTVHSGSSHAQTQAAAEATAAAALSAHVTDPTDAHDASAVSFVPTGTIAATDVQAAIAEAAAEASDLTGAVILAPASSARNVIQPTAGAVIAAIVKAHAAQSVDIFRVENSAGGGYARVGATGAVGLGAGSYDPAGYGGYLTQMVLSRAGDGYYDAGGGPPIAPSSDTFVAQLFLDGEFAPAVDMTLAAYQIGASWRATGVNDFGTVVGLYSEALHFGTKVAGSGSQGAFNGFQASAGSDPSATGDLSFIRGGSMSAYHEGSGVLAELEGMVVGATLYSTAALSTSVIGLKARAHVAAVSGAAVPVLTGIQVDVDSAGRAVTLAKGIDIPNVGRHANVATSYGLYIAAQTGSTNVYGLYVAGGKSVFVDSLITGKIALPADADFANGQGAWWWDQANSLPKWKGKTSGGVVVNFTPGSGGAPTTATYITQTADAGLSAEQALSALATGLVKNTTGTGVLSIGAQGTDYYAPGGTDVAIADGGTGASTAAAARTALDVPSNAEAVPTVYYPALNGLLAANFDPHAINTNNRPTTGYIYMLAIPVPLQITITNVVVAANAGGATLTAGQNFVGIYNAAGTLIAKSADQAAAWVSAGLPYVIPVTAEAGQSLTQGGSGVVLYIAILSVGTTTPAFLTDELSSVYAHNFGRTAATFRGAYFSTGSQTSLPATLNMATRSSIHMYWGGLS